MRGGWITGTLSGALVSSGLLGAISLVSPLPARLEPPAVWIATQDMAPASGAINGAPGIAAERDVVRNLPDTGPVLCLNGPNR